MNEQLMYDPSGVALTNAAEGERLEAYQDPKGVWTIGIGHTGQDVHEGLVITEAQSMALLLADLTTAEQAVYDLVTIALTQNQFDGLVDFVFNEGRGHFASSTLLRKLNSGDFEGAAEEFMKWDICGGKVLSALVTRRKLESNLFRKPANALPSS